MLISLRMTSMTPCEIILQIVLPVAVSFSSEEFVPVLLVNYLVHHMRCLHFLMLSSILPRSEAFHGVPGFDLAVNTAKSAYYICVYILSSLTLTIRYYASSLNIKFSRPTNADPVSKIFFF